MVCTCCHFDKTDKNAALEASNRTRLMEIRLSNHPEEASVKIVPDPMSG